MGSKPGKDRRVSSSSTHSFSSALRDYPQPCETVPEESTSVDDSSDRATVEEGPLTQATAVNSDSCTESPVVPKKSDTGCSSISSTSQTSIPKKSETTNSESGFLSDDEFSTDSELSSDDSLFEFEIDESHGTLKLKPKPNVIGKEKHPRRRKKHAKRDHKHRENEEHFEDGVEEVDFFQRKERRQHLHKLKDSLKTGDLCVMYRKMDPDPQFAIFVDYAACAQHFPLLILKGRSKFISLAEFSRRQCLEVKLISASSRIFYGDFVKVYIHRLKTDVTPSCFDIDKVKDVISKYTITATERDAIEREIASLSPLGVNITCGEDSVRPTSRILKVPSCLVAAHVYHHLGFLKGDPCQARPNTLCEMLDLEHPIRVRVPKPRKGPMQKGEPPLFSRLVDDAMDVQPVDTVKLQSISENLQTGDIVLMKGITVSGSIIRLFDQSEFSHIGMIFKAPFISQVMVFEASTNKAGLVDIETGKVTQGVELLPLEAKIFSGWYGRVAIRHLIGVSEEERQELNQKLMGFFEEVSGRPYEKNKLDLILSSMKFLEEALPFLKNRKEDLSSLFCSELVAAALQRMGIIDDIKVSHSFTPDDFSSNRDLVLRKGSLSKEIYIDLSDADSHAQMSVQSL